MQNIARYTYDPICCEIATYDQDGNGMFTIRSFIDFPNSEEMKEIALAEQIIASDIPSIEFEDCLDFYMKDDGSDCNEVWDRYNRQVDIFIKTGVKGDLL